MRSRHMVYRFDIGDYTVEIPLRVRPAPSAAQPRHARSAEQVERRGAAAAGHHQGSHRSAYLRTPASAPVNIAAAQANTAHPDQ